MQGRRGRPPKIAEEPVTSDMELIAQVLHAWCSIPGCSPPLHEAEAREIVALLKSRGYIIIKGAN